MSLNRTEKNNRNYVTKLIIDSENLINDESRKWLATSQANKSEKKVEDENNTTTKDNKGSKDEEIKMN